MASSSNSKRPFCSSSSSSSSSNSKWRYDVFLSFRGEDTRNNFTSHLYKALDHASIETFKDDKELRRGEEIAPELLKAIEGSRIALIVFSKTYADSKWCLDELVKIMECKEEKGQKVFPIFYHVEPSEVRKQTGIYGEAFNNHESNADEEKKKKIEKWRTALWKAGNLSGFHLKDDSPESEFIEEIIGDIRRLIPKLVYVGENIVGMDENLKEVKLLIDAQSNKVSMVGIYGTGGIGKTTIAKVVYNGMLDQFKHHSFLENVREKSKDDPGLLELQKKLLYDILMDKDSKISNIGEGIEEIKSKCCFEKVLIVLDDVDCPRQLEFLAPNSECFHRGSIIIVTTRNKRCLDVHKSYSLYEAKGLAHKQAKELFCWNAFKQHHQKDNYVDLSNRMMDYAKGLPLALAVLGSFLYQRDVDEWESTLHKLKTTPFKDIQNVLQISYDGLDDICKKLFLDIACFFKGHNKEFVTSILEGCDLHPKIGLKVLDERCLISILGGTIRMHDLLQEMGWAIVRQKYPKHPGKWSRLWEYEDIESVFTKNMGTKNIEGIFINYTKAKPIQFTVEAFKKLNRLRLLKVEEDMVQLSQDFELPCRDLVYFHWVEYPLESLPSNFHVDNLVELNLQYSNIKHLWEGNMPAKKLKVINLRHSKHLVDISSISSVPNLEILILEGCIRLESLPRNLHTLECLQTLSCYGCSKMKSFPEIKGNMGRLRELDLSETDIIEVPSSIRFLHGLKTLKLSDCLNLVSLQDGICSLSSLQTLLLDGSSELKAFLDINIGSLKALEWLDLSYCENLESLPDSICSLTSLQTLLLNGCSKLKAFPNINIGSLKALELLALSYCENLESLPNSICNLTSLQTLMLKECSKLKGFPDTNIGSLKALKLLDLSYCENLESLPDGICSLTSLQTLLLNGCSKLKAFPDINIANLKVLELVDFSYCENLGSLPDRICSLASLQTLLLKKCSNLKAFPDINIRSLKALKLLDLSYCENLKSLPDSICSLTSLQTLLLNGCSKLKAFPDINIGSLKALELLDLSYCKNLESLPHSICSLTSLQTLLLNGCSKLKAFPDINVGSLKALELLDLSYCENLESLPHSICSLTSLQTLLLNGCSKLTVFPDINIGSLKVLELLDLSYCESLESLPDSICSLTSLQTLWLNGCSKLKVFPDINIGSLKALEFLDLSCCEKLESLPMSICNLSSLKTLRIKDYPKLKGILKMNLGVDLCSLRSLNLTCHISNSGVIWDNDCFSSLKALNPRCPLSSLVELSVRNSNLMERDILSASFHLSSLQILSLRNFPLMVGGILDDIFHLSSLVELSLSECNLMEVGTLHYIWNLSSLLRLYLRNCNLMEGEIPNHIWHLSSLEELYLDGNHFSSLPAGISRLTNLRVLDLSHCKNLQQIPELPSSLRFLDAHCSGGISSSPSPLPIHSMVNCFKPEIPVPRIHAGCTFFVGNGISIVVPRSSGIPEWIRYQSMGGYKVTIELPRNWYENKDLLGFALCCVYESDNGFVFESRYESTDTSDNEPDNGSAHESQYESADTSNNEPDNGSAYKSADTSDNELDNGSAYESTYESQNESDDTSDNEPANGSAYESENETAHTSDNEEPVEFYCNLSIRGNNQSAVVDSFKLGSYCANDGASDIVWVIFYPKVAFKEAIKQLYRSNQWTHFMASFGGFGRVEQCRIRLIYAEE